MAWIVGSVSAEERKELERRGWRLDQPHVVFENEPGSWPDDCVAVYVDNDVFQIMNGPDWDKGGLTHG